MEILLWFYHGFPNLPPQPSKSTRILLIAAQRTQVVLQRASPEEKEAAACTRFPTKDVSNSELFPFKKLIHQGKNRWHSYLVLVCRSHVFTYLLGTVPYILTMGYIPPLGKGKSSSKVPCSGICKFPGRVINPYPCHSRNVTTF